MTELKCPFCGQEFREIYFNGVGVGYICPNPGCIPTKHFKGSEALWQALIDTKNQLTVERTTHDILQEELKKLQKELADTKKKLDVAVERLTQISQESFQGDTQSINLGFHVRAAAALTDIEQINKKE